MNEYIERKDALKNEEIFTTNTGREISIVRVHHINAIPAADVAPVVHGTLRINNQGFLECSACGKALRMPLTSTSEMRRCYICGAIFKKGTDDEYYGNV